MASEPITLDEALKDLEKATDRYREAKVALDAASRDETDAINMLNQSQQRVDRLMADLKSAAPNRSDWKSSTRKGVAVP